MNQTFVEINNFRKIKMGMEKMRSVKLCYRKSVLELLEAQFEVSDEFPGWLKVYQPRKLCFCLHGQTVKFSVWKIINILSVL